MLIYHDSQDKVYRYPAGAQPCGQRVCLRLLAPADSRCTLRLWYAYSEKKIVMRPLCPVRGQMLFEASFVLPQKPDLIWYAFLVETDGKTLWYGNREDGLGGAGTICEGEGKSYQITCYDASFAVPDWMADAAVYQIFADRFYLGGKDLRGRLKRIHAHKAWNERPEAFDESKDPEYYPYDFFGGNLQGVIEKLPYLRELGINAIYFNPLFTARSNHKYDTADYHTIDPGFGDNELFQTLCQKAKALGIRVLLDGVFSHTGDDSLYFNRYGHYDTKGACQGEKSPYYTWYDFEHFPDKYSCWWGVPTLPQVNENEPSYRRFIIEGEDAVAAKWLRLGASGWRLDVADELPDSFIEALRRRVKRENPEACLIGEVWEDASNKISYGHLRGFALGNSLDSVMNYPLREMLLDFFTGRQDAFTFARRLRALQENYPPAMFYALMNLMGSHDRPRALNMLAQKDGEGLSKGEQAQLRLSDGEYVRAREKLMAMFSLVCALPGMPTIYYGDEAGMQGASDPFCRGTYPWGREDALLQQSFAQSLKMRAQEPLLRHGKFRLEALDADTLCALRYDDGARLAYLLTRGENRHVCIGGKALYLQRLRGRLVHMC